MNINVVTSRAHSRLTDAGILSAILRASDGALIHNGRNSLWAVRVGEDEYVVKHFRRCLKNAIAYSVRSSKAKRSLRHAEELITRGISTPRPVAYAEERNAVGMLGDSWYVCSYEPAMSLEEALRAYGESCLEAFAAFVAMLHERGVRHDDLNNTNVRVNLAGDGTPVFSLIDLNRMKIYPAGTCVPTDECLRNICRFCDIDDGFDRFVRVYLECRRLPRCLMLRAVKVKARHEQKGRLKKRIKKLILRR